jgi:hypothetical protein
MGIGRSQVQTKAGDINALLHLATDSMCCGLMPTADAMGFDLPQSLQTGPEIG